LGRLQWRQSGVLLPWSENLGPTPPIRENKTVVFLPEGWEEINQELLLILMKMLAVYKVPEEISFAPSSGVV